MLVPSSRLFPAPSSSPPSPPPSFSRWITELSGRNRANLRLHVNAWHTHARDCCNNDTSDGRFFVIIEHSSRAVPVRFRRMTTSFNETTNNGKVIWRLSTISIMSPQTRTREHTRGMPETIVIITKMMITRRSEASSNLASSSLPGHKPISTKPKRFSWIARAKSNKILIEELRNLRNQAGLVGVWFESIESLEKKAEKDSRLADALIWSLKTRREILANGTIKRSDYKQFSIRELCYLNVNLNSSSWRS